MKIPLLLRSLPALVLLLVSAELTFAFNLEGYSWPKGSKVVMQLGLGTQARALQDGSGSWNNVAADAVAIWNGYHDVLGLQ